MHIARSILTILAVSFIAIPNALSCPWMLTISSDVFENQSLPFIEHVGPANDRFGTTLAMNVQYDPILSLRDQIQTELNLAESLKFFTAWAEEGEAHVTTVTPVEYHDKLRAFVSPEKMNEIAVRYDIQSSDLRVLGLGRGQAILNGQPQETYFVIVESENLLKIRRAIYDEYIQNGGPLDGWNPEHFYPHITIGYTARDLHEDDGVLKDADHSLDTRFTLQVTN